MTWLDWAIIVGLFVCTWRVIFLNRKRHEVDILDALESLKRLYDQVSNTASVQGPIIYRTTQELNDLADKLGYEYRATEQKGWVKKKK